MMYLILISCISAWAQPKEKRKAVPGSSFYSKKIDSLLQKGEDIIRCSPDLSREDALQALEYAQAENDLQNTGRAYLILGNANFYLGRFDLALQYAQKAERIFRMIDEPILTAQALNLTGSIYLRFPDSEKSLNYFQRALVIFDSLDYKSGSAESLNLIGNLYNTWEEYDKAMGYYNQSLRIREELNDTSGIASSLNNIALIFIEQEKYDTAIACYEKSIQSKLQQKYDGIGLGNAYNNLGDTYLKLKDYEKALKNHLFALEYRQRAHNRRGIGSSYNNIGNIYYEEGDYEKAIAYYSKGLEVNITETNYRNYEGLAMVYMKLNDYDRAFFHYQKYARLRDSLFNVERYRQIALMETMFQTKKKEQEVVLLQKENEIKNLQISRSRAVTLIIAGVFIFTLIITIMWIRQNKIRAKHEKLDLEQKLLRTQMNPHFIFNSLIAIQNYILKNKPASAAEYLAGFAKLMRDILHNSTRELVSLAWEVEFIRQYLLLQQLRFDNRFDFTIEVADDIEAEETGVPPMIAQPFIENSIEHGIALIPGKGHLDIRFMLQNSHFLFVLTDNGIGIEKSGIPRSSGHKSMATDLTNKRIDNLNKHQRKKYKLQIIDLHEESFDEQGTKIVFQMPLIYI